MHSWLKTVVVTIIMLSSGCVIAPPSAPLSFHQLGQFQHVPLNANTYRIQFKANPQFSYSHAEEITLVKSAQFTLQEGYDFFKVIDDPSNRLNQQSPRQAVVYPSRPMFDPYPYSPRYGRYPAFWNDPFFDAPYTIDVDPIEVSYTIELYKKQLAPGDAFEAQRILQALGEKYQLNADGTEKIISPTPPKQ